MQTATLQPQKYHLSDTVSTNTEHQHPKCIFIAGTLPGTGLYFTGVCRAPECLTLSSCSKYETLLSLIH